MKRNHFLLIGVFALLSAVFSSCWVIDSVRGDGRVTEETRQVDEFDRIEVSRGMNVYITQGSPVSVVVIADNNLHELIRTEVHGHVLKVYAERNIREAEEKKVMITVPKLYGVETSSGANVWSQGQIMSEDMNAGASSGSNINLELNVKNLDAHCSSGANIWLSGVAKEAEMEVSSGANIQGGKLKVGECSMKASSGGNVWATVEDRLDAHASSGGNVFYMGSPNSIDVSSSSGGNIIRK